MSYQDDVLFMLRVKNSPTNRAEFEKLRALSKSFCKQLEDDFAAAFSRGVKQGVASARGAFNGSSAARPWPGVSGLGGYGRTNYQPQSPNPVGGGATVNVARANAYTQQLNQTTAALNQNTNANNKNNQSLNQSGFTFKFTTSLLHDFTAALRSHLAGYASISAMTHFISDVIRLGSELERTQVRFEVLTGSAEKANTLMSQMRSLSAMSGTPFSSLTRGASTMLGYNVDPKMVAALMKPVNNITAGDSGAAQRMAIAVSQVLGMGKLKAQERNQMINAGMNPLIAISKYLGKDLKEVSDMMRAGAISADIFAEALIRTSEAGGQFEGFLERLADTNAGRISKLTSEWERLQVAIYDSQSGPLADILNAAQNVVGGWRGAIEGPPKTNNESLAREYEENERRLRAAQGGGSLFSKFSGIGLAMWASSSLELGLGGMDVKSLKARQEQLKKAMEMSAKADRPGAPDFEKLRIERMQESYDDLYAKEFDKKLGSQYGFKATRVIQMRENVTPQLREQLDLMIAQGKTVEEMARILDESTRAEDNKLGILLDQNEAYKKQEELQTSISKAVDEAYKIRDENQKRLTSGAENFADMSLLDKKLAIQASSKLKGQGFSALNRDERDILSKLGLQETDDAVRKSKLAEADQFGFSRYFGSFERETISKTEDAIKQAQAEIAKVTSDIKIELQANVEITGGNELVQKVIDELRTQKEEILRNVETRFKEERDKKKIEDANKGPRNMFGI